jgi:hypothetical protein
MIPSGRAIRSIGILKGRSETCPVRAMETWLRVSRCKFGPVFGKVNVWGTVEQDSLPSHSVSTIFRNRVEKAGGSGSALSSEFHWATPGFVLGAYMAGAGIEEIMSGIATWRPREATWGVPKLVDQRPAELLDALSQAAPSPLRHPRRCPAGSVCVSSSSTCPHCPLPSIRIAERRLDPAKLCVEPFAFAPNAVTPRLQCPAIDSRAVPLPPPSHQFGTPQVRPNQAVCFRRI